MQKQLKKKKKKEHVFSAQLEWDAEMLNLLTFNIKTER